MPPGTTRGQTQPAPAVARDAEDRPRSAGVWGAEGRLWGCLEPALPTPFHQPS